MVEVKYKNNFTINVSDADINYVAGVFDSTGHIDIKIVNDGKKIRHHLSIAIFGMKDVIHKIDSILPSHSHQNGGAGYFSNQYVWFATGKQAAEFLKVLRPFVVGKDKYIDTALEYSYKRTTNQDIKDVESYIKYLVETKYKKID